MAYAFYEFICGRPITPGNKKKGGMQGYKINVPRNRDETCTISHIHVFAKIHETIDMDGMQLPIILII